MLSRAELKSFQSHRDYPAVSILAPTHRTSPANKQDPIKVKNLVRRAVQRLHKEFSKREVAGVVSRLEQLVKQVDWQHTLTGLALFASREQSALITLPFRVKARAIVDETFATRDLLYAYNRAVPYRVLTLSHTARLYDAWTTVLEEHTAKPFPLVHKLAGGAAKLPAGKGINRSSKRDDATRQFYRSVDEALAVVQRAHPLPLVLAGVERNLAFFQEVTRHGDIIHAHLAGNHDETSPDALGKLAWPLFESGSTRQRVEALVRLDDAVSADRNASGIAQVWRAAGAGKCQTLLVEKDYKYAADASPDGDRLLPYTGQGPLSFDDAVDEIIERVIDSGGEVYFYPPGDLELHQRIAGVLRR
ncbi:MAG: hypothetical protein J5I93_22460 [Pirellulaceae bacterium]|nr:hypothetical protein [Pirellulaceae bacterium]